MRAGRRRRAGVRWEGREGGEGDPVSVSGGGRQGHLTGVMSASKFVQGRGSESLPPTSRMRSFRIVAVSTFD